MANFYEMLVWLEQGKKVRRVTWSLGSFLYVDNNIIVNNFHEPVKFCHMGCFKKTDWVILEDFDLSKLHVHIMDGTRKMQIIYYQNDVKKLIRKIKEECNMNYNKKEVVDRLSGDKLWG